MVKQEISFTHIRNPATIRARWDKEVADAKKNNRVYATAREALADLWDIPIDIKKQVVDDKR